MIIAVLGATGVYARHLLPRLISAGHRVRALVRRPEAAGIARACGADIRVADIFHDASLIAALDGCEIGINLATSLPGPSGRGDYETNDRVRSAGAVNWVNACKAAGVDRVIQQSIGMVNSAGSDAWSDEDTIYRSSGDSIASRAIAASLSMEQTITASGLDWIVLRGGLFYGPGTGFDDDWHSRAAAGKLRLPDEGDDFVSLVHIADMAAATVAAVSRWPSRRALIVCDSEPARWRDVFRFIADAAGQAELKTGGQAGFPSFRLKNQRAREALDWGPFYASYRSGLVR